MSFSDMTIILSYSGMLEKPLAITEVIHFDRVLVTIQDARFTLTLSEAA